MRQAAPPLGWSHPRAYETIVTARLAAVGPPGRTQLTQDNGSRRRCCHIPAIQVLQCSDMRRLHETTREARMTAAELTAETAAARAYPPGNGRQPRRRARARARRSPARRLGRRCAATTPAGSGRPHRLFQGAVAAAGRTGQVAGLGAARKAEGRRAVRRPRLRRQGRRDQAHHPAPQSARSAASPRCRRRTSANARNGISSAMSRICRPAARSCCSTAAGTTAPASSA